MPIQSNQPTSAFISASLLNEEIRLEIGRMLQEGMSIEDIKIAVEGWIKQPLNYVTFTDTSPLEEYMQKYPTWPVTVEGSITEPITDEGRLLS